MMAEDPSETAGDVSSYLCQWKEAVDDYEQSVNAHLPYSTTKMKCTTPWWDSRAATTRLSVHQRDRGSPVFTEGSHVHQDTRGYDIAFAGEHWNIDDRNRLFDFTASYHDIAVTADLVSNSFDRSGDAAGNTLITISGYGFDTGVDASVRGRGRNEPATGFQSRDPADSHYYCQFKALGSDYQQSVLAHRPTDSRTMTCTTEWWDHRAETTRVTLHKHDRNIEQFVDDSWVDQDTRGYDLAFQGEHWGAEDVNRLFDFTSSWRELTVYSTNMVANNHWNGQEYEDSGGVITTNAGDSAGGTSFSIHGYGFDKEAALGDYYCLFEDIFGSHAQSVDAYVVEAPAAPFDSTTGAAAAPPQHALYSEPETSERYTAPVSSTEIRCTTEWWDWRATTTRVTLKRPDKFDAVFDEQNNGAFNKRDTVTELYDFPRTCVPAPGSYSVIGGAEGDEGASWTFAASGGDSMLLKPDSRTSISGDASYSTGAGDGESPFDGSGAFAVAKRTVNVLPETRYVLSGFIKNKLRGEEGTAYLDLNDETFAIYTGTFIQTRATTSDTVNSDCGVHTRSTRGLGAWEFVHCHFWTADQTTVDVRMVVDGVLADGSAAWFDDVALTPATAFGEGTTVARPAGSSPTRAHEHFRSPEATNTFGAGAFVKGFEHAPVVTHVYNDGDAGTPQEAHTHVGAGCGASGGTDRRPRHFDFTASYYEIDKADVPLSTHVGAEMGHFTTYSRGDDSFKIYGYGFDPDAASGQYMCKFRDTRVGALSDGIYHEQSVPATSSGLTTEMSCVTPWWEASAGTVEVTLHRLDRYTSTIWEKSLSAVDGRRYDIPFFGEFWVGDQERDGLEGAVRGTVVYPPDQQARAHTFHPNLDQSMREFDMIAHWWTFDETTLSADGTGPTTASADASGGTLLEIVGAGFQLGEIDFRCHFDDNRGGTTNSATVDAVVVTTTLMHCISPEWEFTPTSTDLTITKLDAFDTVMNTVDNKIALMRFTGISNVFFFTSLYGLSFDGLQYKLVQVDVRCATEKDASEGGGPREGCENGGITTMHAYPPREWGAGEISTTWGLAAGLSSYSAERYELFFLLEDNLVVVDTYSGVETHHPLGGIVDSFHASLVEWDWVTARVYLIGRDHGATSHHRLTGANVLCVIDSENGHSVDAIAEIEGVTSIQHGVSSYFQTLQGEQFILFVGTKAFEHIDLLGDTRMGPGAPNTAIRSSGNLWLFQIALPLGTVAAAFDLRAAADIAFVYAIEYDVVRRKVYALVKNPPTVHLVEGSTITEQSFSFVELDVVPSDENNQAPTGAVVRSLALPDVTAVHQGVSSFDPVEARFFFLSSSSAVDRVMGPEHVVIVDVVAFELHSDTIDTTAHNPYLRFIEFGHLPGWGKTDTDEWYYDLWYGGTFDGEWMGDTNAWSSREDDQVGERHWTKRGHVDG